VSRKEGVIKRNQEESKEREGVECTPHISREISEIGGRDGRGIRFDNYDVEQKVVGLVLKGIMKRVKREGCSKSITLHLKMLKGAEH